MPSDDDVIVVCTECKSDQPVQYIERNPFGDRAPCKYCGGVLMVTYREWRDKALNQIDGQRNIGHDPNTPR